MLLIYGSIVYRKNIDYFIVMVKKKKRTTLGPLTFRKNECEQVVQDFEVTRAQTLLMCSAL